MQAAAALELEMVESQLEETTMEDTKVVMLVFLSFARLFRTEHRRRDVFFRFCAHSFVVYSCGISVDNFTAFKWGFRSLIVWIFECASVL